MTKEEFLKRKINISLDATICLGDIFEMSDLEYYDEPFTEDDLEYIIEDNFDSILDCFSYKAFDITKE